MHSRRFARSSALLSSLGCCFASGATSGRFTTTNSSDKMDKFIAHLKALHREKDGFKREYGMARALADTKPNFHDRVTSDAPGVGKRNRYCDVVTFEDTRVRLLGQGKEEDTDKKIDSSSSSLSSTTTESDYINASFVEYAPGDVKTIVAQGPLRSTAGHFWQMCIEQNVGLIVMLTEFDEPHGPFGEMREKCFKYFALKQGERTGYGDYTVECKSIATPHPGWTDRLLVVTDRSRGMSKEVRHVHCFQWPDFGVLDQSHLAGLQWSLNLFDSERNAGRGPAVVHCSAGIGRSGTFVAIDQLLHQAKSGEEDLNVCRVVASLRDQRPGMVQTVKQYEMIYIIVAILLGCDVSFLQG